MPITRLSTDLERSSARPARQEPAKVAGIHDKPRVETGGGGGGGPGANVAGKRATKAYAASRRVGAARPAVLASHIMTSPVRSVSFSQSIASVRNFLKETGLNHLPVVDASGLLVGLLTDRDLLRGYRVDSPEQKPLHPSTQVLDLMQTGIITATDDTELRDIAQAMVNDGVRCIPIVNGDRILGIITATDVLKCVVSTGTLDGWL